MNPNLKQTLLHPGDELIIPLFCKCPSNTQLDKGIRYMIPYVWQPDDDLLKVAAKLNASADDIQNEKNIWDFTAIVGHPVIIPVSQLPFLSQFFPSPPEKGKFCHRWIIISVVSVAVFLLVFIVVALLLCTHSYKKNKALNHSGSGLDIAVPFSSKELHKSECYKPKIIKDKLLPRILGCIGQPIMYDKKYMTRSYIPVNYAEIAEIVFSLTVLTHSSSETLERSWSSAPELEEVSQIVCPASATPR